MALATTLLATALTAPASGAILATDFTDRTVSGKTASTIIWTTDGISAPGSSLTVDNKTRAQATGNLFDTADAAGYFAVANNVGNGGVWEVQIDIATVGDDVELTAVDLGWGMFSATGALQPVARNATYTVDILDSSDVSILASIPSTELIGITGVVPFSTPVTLGASTSYTLVTVSAPEPLPPVTSIRTNIPVDISDAAGKNVYLEFRFQGTDGSYLGLYIDDITIKKVLPSANPPAYLYLITGGLPREVAILSCGELFDLSSTSPGRLPAPACCCD